MRFSITSWNINSVRLRIDQVTRFPERTEPRTCSACRRPRCPIDKFPEKAIRAAGYEHIAFAGMKGYNGVAIISRFRWATSPSPASARKRMRAISRLRLGPQAPGEAAGLAIHNFYVPLGATWPIRRSIRNSRTSCNF